MKGLWELCWEVFRGYFLWFSRISVREKALAGDFCGVLVNFWSYSKAEYVRMRVTWNVYYLAVVVVLVAGARQWEIPVMVNLRRDDNVLKSRKRTRRLSARF